MYILLYRGKKYYIDISITRIDIYTRIRQDSRIICFKTTDYSIIITWIGILIDTITKIVCGIAQLINWIYALSDNLKARVEKQ